MKLNFILKICAVASFIVLLTYSYYKIPKITFGFTGYYTFSRMLLEGDDLSIAYNAEQFNKKINDFGIANVYELYNIAPTSAFVFLPFAVLNPPASKVTWGIFSIILLIFSLVLVLKVFDFKLLSNRGLLITIIFFLWHPFYENIAWGQIYILLLFLFLLSIYGIKHNRKFLTTIPLSLNILFKGYGVLVILLFAFIKRYKIFFISLAFIFLVIMLTMPVIDFNTWKKFIELTLSMLGRFREDSIIVYQNLNGIFRHLFVYDKILNPNSIADIPSDFIFVFVIIFNFFITILFLVRSKKIISNDKKNEIELIILSYSAVIGLSVITAPMAEEYHYALYLPFVIAMGDHLFKGTISQNAVFPVKINQFLKIQNSLYIASVLLILLPINYRFFQSYHFPLYLFGYPKLYGGIILLILFYFIPNFSKNKFNLSKDNF